MNLVTISFLLILTNCPCFQIVGFLHTVINRWIRVRIEHEFDWLGQEKSFAVFAIDDGFPVMAQLKYMRRLTKDQASMPSNVIHRGAISCVLPCEKVIIILTSKTKRHEVRQ